MSDPAPIDPAPRPQISLVSSGSAEPYRRLAEIFHDVLSEQSLDALLERIADTLAELIPYEDVHIYEADEAKRELKPVLARSEWADEVMSETFSFGEGITGWAVDHREAVLANQAHLDPRVRFVPGTPIEPEALIAVPLVARGQLKGTLNIYRVGEDAAFSDEEFLLAKRFGDAAALAIDNAHIRARLEHQAETDALTGLYNHRAFHDRLRQELLRASAAHETVAVVMIDLDDFKKVNDVYGHGIGDYLLQQVADVLRGSVRASDVVCRVGGEEFAVILPSGDMRSSNTLAERIGDQLGKLEAEAVGKLTVSTGIAIGPENAANPRELVACAEAAMMTAKTRGKGLVVPFDESARERPSEERVRRDDVRSIAHLKMLQSLSGKLSRLNDVAQIGLTIADELRLLVDYHNCRVFLRDDDDLVPVAFRGDLIVDEPGRPGRPPADAGRPRHHGPRRRDGRVAPRRRRRATRVRRADRGHGRDRGVAPRRPAQVRHARDRRHRHLEARARPVRRGRPPPARGDGGARLRRSRERAPVRGAAREAESAKALLALSRDLAEAVGNRRGRRAGRRRAPRASSRARARPSGSSTPATARSSGSPAFPDRPRDEDERTSGSPAEHLEPWLGRTEPYIVDEPTTQRSPPRPRARRAASQSRRSRSTGAGESSQPPYRSKPAHDDRDLELLGSIARQTQLALQTAASYETLERTFLSTVEALANALEANDEYTSSHARWITDLALRVGEELGLEPHELKRLELGALFHDIGKIGIPSRILAKPGPLTPEERRSSRRTRSSASASSRRSSSSARYGSSSAARTSTTTARGIRTASSASRSRSSRASSSRATRSTR